MASLRKQQASRANSLRSTGPKSTLGKRLASQNSRTHGLSVVLPDEVIEPVVAKLVPLIIQDGIEQNVARQVAMKLVDYERNLAHERAYFVKLNAVVDIAPLDQDEISQAIFTNELVRQVSVDPESLHMMSKAKKQERGWMIESLKFLIKTHKIFQNKAKAKDNSDRHYKRAANQFIKALRSV
jgi:hypothetical protein